MPSASTVFWRPKVNVPNVLEPSPAYDWMNVWPEALESTFVFWLANGRPLFCTSDFNASLIWPDCGLKNVSSLKTPDQSPASGSRPCRPIRELLKLLGVRPVTDRLLFFRTVS